MTSAAAQEFQIVRHGEIAVVTPSAKVEEMHETMIEQAARMVVQALRTDPPAGIVIDLSQVNYFGSVFVSFLLRCHSLAKKHGDAEPANPTRPPADARVERIARRDAADADRSARIDDFHSCFLTGYEQEAIARDAARAGEHDDRHDGERDFSQ